MKTKTITKKGVNMLNILCDMYDKWCNKNKLPNISACEQDILNLTKKQNKWLRRFINVWDYFEKKPESRLV